MTSEKLPEDELYELHIRLPREQQAKLKTAATLAYKLGLIAKPELTELINLFVNWGMTVLRSQYNKRMGIG